MSTTVPATHAPAPARNVGSLLLTGSAGQAVGISTAVSGAPIPPSGFAAMTVIFSVFGLVIAAALRRFSRHPRNAWLRTTVALTVLSFVPDALADAAVATKVLLMLAHVVAAAIVIPALARRLS